MTKEQYLEDYKGFCRRYDNFIEKNPGDGDYDAREPDAQPYFDAVQESHYALREKIGGIRRVRDVSINAVEGRASEDKAKKYLDEIFKLIPHLPNALAKFNLDSNSLLGPNLQLKAHKIVKTGKFLTQELERVPVRGSVYVSNLSDLNRQLSGLANLWEKTKRENDSYHVNMTTSALSFAMLGHYGVDDDSCFRQGHQNNSNKFTLGMCENSYVILFKKDNRYIARAWGFANEDLDVFNVTNYYLDAGIKLGNIKEACRLFFADLLDTKPESLFIEEDLVDSGNADIYLNGGSWTFLQSTSEADTQELVLKKK